MWRRRSRTGDVASALAALLPVTLVALTVVTSACAGPSRAGDHRLRAVASFYPLQYVLERVGGPLVEVTSLTRPGVDPHDLELTPRDLASIVDADLVVYLRGFQPAVDDAVDAEADHHALDVGPAARLDLTYTPIEGGRAEGDGEERDPHFWLDPTRLASVTDDVARGLTQADPVHASEFAAGAAGLRGDLAALDAQFRAGLVHCASRDLVTSHTAFGYLARRYGLRQVGVTGLDPEQEPSAGDLAAVARFVRDHRVRTVYSETLVSPAIARTIANETGATSAVLDPVEGPSADAPGSDYLAVMRADLAVLRPGQGCR
jgi:zinc transport system substrate-binding protein